MDLAIDEVTTISTIIQEAAGEEAEIIFGAVHDPTMKEEVRVTVIATGFDGAEPRQTLSLRDRLAANRTQPDAASRLRAAARSMRPSSPPPSDGDEAPDNQRVLDLHTPTFIRRQMD
jgi:cell division protein FtsZ